jgi:hypothetical protein
MIDQFDQFDQFYTNRDLGDEQEDTPAKGKNYYLVLDENGCLDIPKDRDTNDTTS